MGKHEDRGVWWSMPLAVAALGCGPGEPTSLEAGVDESGEDDGSGGGGSGGGGGSSGGGGGDPGNPGGEPDGVAPRLVWGRTDETGKYVLLRFSEPMAPPDGVDPSDFRLSQALTWMDHYYGYVYTHTTYQDPHYYWGYMLSMLTSVTAGGVNTDLVLEFSEPLPAYMCDSIEQMQANIEVSKMDNPDFDARVGLFPHYSPGATPIRSAQGEPVAAIGPEWAEIDSPYMYNNEFGFPNLSPQIPLDCIIGD